MPINDIFLVFRWWLALFITGVAFFPLCIKLFSSFKDKGYAFSKILGTIILSYFVFILGLLKFTAFTPLTIYLIFIICSAIILIYWGKYYKALNNKKLIALLVIEEIIFFVGLLSWSFIRGFNPEIIGLEKYMDFGFVNTILRSTYFPPTDLWYPPYPINYYYFGHFITAVITKSTQIPSYIAYNLMIATLFALAFVQSFSIGLNLLYPAVNRVGKFALRVFIGSILIACLVTLSGNLHIIYTFFKPYDVDKPIPFWQSEFSLINPCYQKESYEKTTISGKKETIYCSKQEKSTISTYPNSYWYPNATRFIHNTIHEFPIYSWVVADLHGHVADIPIVLLTIAVLFSFLIYFSNEKVNLTTVKVRIIIIGFLLAIMYTTNAWDGLTYLLLTGIIFFYLQWNRVYYKKIEHLKNPLIESLEIINKRLKIHKVNLLAYWIKNYLHKHLYIDLASGIITYLFICLLAFFIFSRPFSINFDPSKIVGGVGVVGAPSFLLNKNNHSNDNKINNKRNIIEKIFIPDHCKSLINIEGQNTTVDNYSVRKIGPFLFEPDHCLRSPWWQLLILYGFFYFFIFVFILFLQFKKALKPTDKFVLILITVSTLLIIIPEFFYMKDIYPDHYRANTMFKLVFQAFIMLSISSGYIFMRTTSKLTLKALALKLKLFYILYILLAVSLLTLVFIYPYFAIKSYYNGLTSYKGLNGLNYLKDKNLSDYEAINWLNKNIKGQPVILEAQGDSYTDYERISANTGFPTILGWYVHEWLWRGQDAPQSRTEDIRRIYEDSDLTSTKSLILKYSVKYIIIGNLEKQKYSNLNEDKFSQIGKKVFQSESTSIYKINF